MQQASVIFNGITLGVTALPQERLRGAWRTITLQHTRRGLSVRLDRTHIFSGVLLPDFRPTGEWRMALGARCGRAHDAHTIDAVYVEFGAGVESGHAPVEIAPNGRDFSQGQVGFEYYTPPTVTSVEPPCGPGHTVDCLAGGQRPMHGHGRQVGHDARRTARRVSSVGEHRVVWLFRQRHGAPRQSRMGSA